MKIPSAPLPEIIDNASSAGGALTIMTTTSQREQRSYQDLASEAASRAGGLHELGITRGARVGLYARATFDFVIACLGIWRAGAVVVPLAPPGRFISRSSSLERVKAIVDKAQLRAVLVDPELDNVPGGRAIPFGEIPDSSQAEVEGPAAGEIAMIQFTSGATSSPKGVVLTHAAIAAQLEAHRLARRCDNPESDHFVAWAPLHHNQGFFILLLRPMATGVPVTVFPTELFLAKPETWLYEISDNAATYSTAPNFGYVLAASRLERGLQRPIDLRSWVMVSSGAESVDPATMDRFLAAAAPFGLNQQALSAAYGLAEATCTVAAGRIGAGLKVLRLARDKLAEGEAADSSAPDAVSLVSTGPPLPGLDVRVIRDGELVGERQVGEVQVRGPCVMQGYLDAPEATAAAFDGEWLKTGDKGFLADGELYITGRIKETIVIHGHNYYAEDVERIASSVEGVGRCAAFAIAGTGPDRLGLAVEVQAQDGEGRSRVIEQVKQHVWSAMGVPTAVVVLLPGELPVSASGKLRRTDLPSLLSRDYK